MDLSSTKAPYKPISSYGIIGNCRSSALVSDEASIDWCCLPDFDSPACFLKILDTNLGGYFQIIPIGFFKSHQKYIENTNVLETVFFNHSGTASVTDLIPISREQEKTNAIPEFGTKFVRLVKAIQGNHNFELKLKVTPNFAQEKVNIKKTDGLVIVESSSTKFVLYKKHHQITYRQGVVYVKFKLSQGEQEFFGLDFLEKSDQPERFSNEQINQKLSQLFVETLNFWGWWAEKCTYNGKYSKQVMRSALTLKLLTFSPTGAIVAAPTTSLPEKIGGNLNWDYRYTWLRDASFTVYAFLGLGYIKEAERFIGWLENICLREASDLKIMYGIHGEKELGEVDMTHLSGYMDSKPVRIGNGAFHQKQFDIYGEVLTAVDLYLSAGGMLSEPMTGFVKKLVDFCCAHWRLTDNGVWESRNGLKHNTYSKLMCWVGIDRGIRIAKVLGLKDADFSFWEYTKNLIKKDILEHGYNKKIKSFVAYYGSTAIDSSTLNIPILGLLPANDPKVLSTLDKIMRKLVIDWFVLRTSDTIDKLKDGEGTFFLSTCWLIDCLSFLGKTEEAKVWLEKIIADGSSLGLYAEEFDPVNKQHLGNFPQAFTHLGIINSILNLEQAEKFGLEHHPTIPAERLLRIVKSVFTK